jgi:type VI secretion system protein ImpA
MLSTRVRSLLSPLSVESPCGADPEYDPVLLALLDASVRKGEQQYGSKIIPAQEPDWQSVHRQAWSLAERTRDLRVAVLVARSTARVEGLAGAVQGLQLVRGLVEQYWSDVHPRLDATEGDDPTARVNALMPLAHFEAGLADLRAASLTGKRGSMTVRDIELALGHAEPLPGESVPTEEGVLRGVRDAIAASPALAPVMLEGWEASQGLSAVLEQHLDATRLPDLDALHQLMQRVADAARRATALPDTTVTATEDPAMAAGTQAGAGASAPGALRSREDVMRSLECACEWIERNEPTNPAPLLIRRSQRLMTKNFVDIIRDLVPESASQIEKLAGQVKT